MYRKFFFVVIQLSTRVAVAFLLFNLIFDDAFKIYFIFVFINDLFSSFYFITYSLLNLNTAIFNQFSSFMVSFRLFLFNFYFKLLVCCQL